MQEQGLLIGNIDEIVAEEVGKLPEIVTMQDFFKAVGHTAHTEIRMGPDEDDCEDGDECVHPDKYID
jgi:hypothetical protein